LKGLPVSSINNCTFVGNLTRDPELRYTPANTAVCLVGLALNSSYKDAAGNKKEEVAFIDCEAWGRLGEVINQYARKGDRIGLVCRVKLDQWQDKEGNNRSKIKFVVGDMMLLGDKRQSQNEQQPPQQSTRQAPPKQQPAQGNFQPVDEDNIPF